jgi:type IV pilus assembly protein PilQ
MKKMNAPPLGHRAAAHALLAAFTALTLVYAGQVGAAEIKSLAWDEISPTPAVHIGLTEDSAYETQRLDDGQRLRISFPRATLSPSLNDIGGRQTVKGVYPYVAENGAAVHIDLLMTEAAEMKVEKMSNGYRVLALSPDAGSSAGASQVAETPTAARAETAPAVDLNTLEQVVYTTLPGGRVQIQLKMAQRPAVPASFSQNNPPRISLDFPNTRTQLTRKNIRINEGAVLGLTAVESQNRTRVVLNLVRPASYTARVEGNAVTLLIDNPAALVSGSQATHTAKTTRFADPARPGKHTLANVDFRRGPQGEGKLIIGLSDSGVGIDIREQGGEVVVDFHDTNAPAELLRRLNVTDFATPVQHIDTFAQGKNTRMVISALGKYEHLAYQVGETLTISVKPVVEIPGEKKKLDEFGYSGEKLSLNFQNIEVRAALQVIADFTGLNLVVSDTVKGTLTLRLKDVPWDQALDIILNAKGLAKRDRGNVVSIAPADEVAAKEKAAFEASKTTSELEPLVSELIQINYAKAEDIAKLLKSIKAIATTFGQHPVFGQGVAVTKESTESNTLLSPRGQVTVDVRTNSLLIQDTVGKIREVRKLIAQLDQPVRQVMIETRLVEATDDFSRNLGVRFGAQTSQVSSGLQTTVGTASDAGGLNVNFPAPTIGGAAAGSIALTIARLGTGDLLNLELSALEAEGRGKIISNPRLITANQKKARIEQGQEQVFTTSVLGVGGVVTKKAVLALEVTPQITPDERVILDVLVTKDSFADTVRGVINKKEITTQVLLDNGETVVIGGIYEQSQQQGASKVPFFGDLPLIGWAFRNNTRTDKKIELLIFLTPRILSDALSLR